MSFTLANRLSNLAATASTLSTDLAENYYAKAEPATNSYTKAQTDTEIANLKTKRLVIRNDNDANDPFLVNDSANANSRTAGKTGNVRATRATSESSISTTGSTGVAVKMVLQR